MRVDYKHLTEHCAALLEAAGACPEHARITAEGLVEADLCGVETHGVSRMEVYLKRLEAGAVLGEGAFTIVKEYAGAALCDGGGALGQVTARKAMELACEKAAPLGIDVAYACWNDWGVPESGTEMNQRCNYSFQTTQEFEEFLF